MGREEGVRVGKAVQKVFYSGNKSPKQQVLGVESARAGGRVTAKIGEHFKVRTVILVAVPVPCAHQQEHHQ